MIEIPLTFETSASGLNETEKEKIISYFEELNKKYDIWWNSRDSRINARQNLRAEPESLSNETKILELEVELQSNFVDMLKARLQFYLILQYCGFTQIKCIQWRKYQVSRMENGELKSYDITA